MTDVHSPFASELLEVGASGYASLAAERLLATQRETAQAVGPRALHRWRDHFALRIRELAAALATGQADLFVARVVWSAHSFTVRGVDTDSLLASLQALRDVLADRLPPNATDAPVAVIDLAQKTLATALPPPDESVISRDAPAGRIALEYLQRALEGDVRGAIDLVLRALEDQGLSPRVVLIEVLLTAQQEVGRLWHLNQLTIAEEHLITAATGRAMAAVVDRAPRAAPAHQRSVLAATLPTDFHDLGLRAVTYLLELEGWRVFYLGADVPQDELVAASSYFGVDLILLSASMSIQLRALREAVAAIRANNGVRAPVLIGGSAFRDAPESWQSTGADAFAGSVEEALLRAGQLVPIR